MAEPKSNPIMGLGIVGGVLVAALLVLLLLNPVGCTTVQGNEVAVRQHLTKGVVDDVWMSGTHFYARWFWQVYKYSVGTQKITFDNQQTNQEAEYASIPVEVGENGGQKAWVSISSNYHLNPSKIVMLHKQGIARNYESVVLKREIIDTVNEIARPHNSALDLYSGTGFVKFKNDVEKALQQNKVLEGRGIDIENTIIYNVHLDPAYEAEIAGKQLAMQQKLRKEQETKAAEEEAKRIFAMSQANVEKVRQESEAQKIIAVKRSEGEAQQQINAAQAEKQKRVLEAEGQRDASLARASGILAEGEAQAKVDALKRESLYAGESGAWRARVEIATAQAEKLKGLLAGVQVIPESAIVQIGKSSLTVEAPKKSTQSDNF